MYKMCEGFSLTHSAVELNLLVLLAYGAQTHTHTHGQHAPHQEIINKHTVLEMSIYGES